VTARAGAVVLGAMAALSAQPFQSDTATTLRVSLIERPIGIERSTLRPAGEGWAFESSLDLTERGGRLQLSSSMTLDAALAPTAFRASGRTYRFVPVDADVQIANGRAQVGHLGTQTTIDLKPPYFTAAGYGPLAARALLIRYWERQMRPAVIRVVPGLPVRDVTVEARGTDSVRVAGRDVALRRYTVNGIVWGRETVWLDDSDRLAAIVTRIHILPMEAVRDDLADAQPALLEIAARDAAADLARLAKEQAPLASGSFALVGATVVTGTASSALEEASVVVQAGRIAAVGPRAEVAIPRGMQALDARGATIVPGLWDMHAHASQIEWAPAYLAAGVTTIRDMGGERRFLLALRDTIAAGRGLGPRVLLAGLVDGDAPNAFGVVVAATPGEGRAIVDRYHADRFSEMKLYSLLAPGVVSAITARAHELGMTVTGHVPTALGARRAIEAGMDGIAHMPGTDAELVSLMASRRIVVDPTAPWGELLGRAPETPVDAIEPGLARGPAALVMSYRSVTNQTDAAAARARVERQLQAIRTLHTAGVPIVAGTDGAVPGHSLLRSIELFVEAGMTPREALQAATIVPARAMRLDRESGSIDVGKRADLLVLEANPLDDIRNIRRARWVVVAGRVYPTLPLWRAAGFAAR
jgi:imidazolonepropionase-like amidohydrolase